MHKYLFFVIILFVGCTKERLNGEVEILQGTWKTKYISGDDYGTHAAILNNDPNYFEIRFAESGKIFLYNQQGDLIERGRIVTYSSHRADSYPYSLYINLTIKSNQILFSKLERINSLVVDGFYSEQTLRIVDFTNDKDVDEFYFTK